MYIRRFAGVISAVMLLSSCMTELSTPPTLPTAAVAAPEAPAEGLPALFAPTEPAAAPEEPAAAPEEPAAPSFVAIDCTNPAPADVEVCNGN